MDGWVGGRVDGSIGTWVDKWINVDKWMNGQVD